MIFHEPSHREALVHILEIVQIVQIGDLGHGTIAKHEIVLGVVAPVAQQTARFILRNGQSLYRRKKSEYRRN